MRAAVRTPAPPVVLVALVVALVGLSGCEGGEQAPSPRKVDATSSPANAPREGPFRVVDVVDGDTIKVDRSGRTVKVRLIGIDTPETSDPRKPVQCFGREASARAKELMAGGEVFLESDPSQGGVDAYGRTLAYVYAGDLQVNRALIEQGFAHEYTYDAPYRYQSEFRAAEAGARSGDRGLWSPGTCDGDTQQAAAPVLPRPRASPSGSPSSSSSSSSVVAVRLGYVDRRGSRLLRLRHPARGAGRARPRPQRPEPPRR